MSRAVEREKRERGKGRRRSVRGEEEMRVTVTLI